MPDTPDVPATITRHRPVPPGHSYIEDIPAHGSGIETLLKAEEGYIIGRMADHLCRLQTDAHLLTVAPTGAGKGIGAVIPNLLDHPGSAFVIDIRGETVERTADARRLMGQNVVVLDPYDLTEGRYGNDSFNPLDMLDPSKERHFESDINRLTRALMFDPDGRMSNEPIWDNVTRIMLNGAITFVMMARPPERRNLREVARLFTIGGEKRAEFERELAYLIAESGDEVYQSLELFWAYLSETREKTKITDNAISQANSVLDWIGRREFRDQINRSSFSFKQLQHEPTTVYLVIPEQYIKGCAVWARALLDAALYSHEDIVATRGISSRQLPQDQRSLFLIDEFAAFGKLEEIESGMATVRGRGINLWLFVQNIGQLDKIYGEHGSRAIIGNAALLQAFESNDFKELDYLSQVIGEEMFDVESVTIGESETTGSSEAIGRSVTITNSESIAHGTSRSVTAGTSRSVGRSESVGRTDTSGTSETTTEGVSDTTGFTEGGSTSISSGSSHSSGVGLGSSSLGSNHSTSTGQSYSRNSSRALSSSRSRGTSRSRARSYTSGKSYTDTTSRSETSGSSETRTHGMSRAEGESVTETATRSTGRSQSVTVKPEQRRIETPRSLRMKISGQNQLVSIRGHYPFLSPRMSYIVRDEETGEYLFPQMYALSSIGTIRKLADRPEIDHAYEGLNAILGRAEDGRLSEAVDEDRYTSETAQIMNSEIADISEFIAGHKRGLDKQLRAFEDSTVSLDMLAGLFGEDWLAPEELAQALARARDASGIEKQEFSNLSALPIFSEEPTPEWEDHEFWLADVYRAPFSEAAEKIETETWALARRAKDQEIVRAWYCGKFDEAVTRLDQLLIERAREEVRKRHAFRLQGYGMADAA